jgi:mycofactocin precursor
MGADRCHFGGPTREPRLLSAGVRASWLSPFCTAGDMPQGGYHAAMDDDDRDDEASQAAGDNLLEELLIEEISIDGMCGVY